MKLPKSRPFTVLVLEAKKAKKPKGRKKKVPRGQRTAESWVQKGESDVLLRYFSWSSEIQSSFSQKGNKLRLRSIPVPVTSNLS
jgi:hypothetical protein